METLDLSSSLKEVRSIARLGSSSRQELRGFVSTCRFEVDFATIQIRCFIALNTRSGSGEYESLSAPVFLLSLLIAVVKPLSGDFCLGSLSQSAMLE